MQARQAVKIGIVKVLTITGIFEPFIQEIDDLSTECEQLRNEVRTLSEQPAIYADDNARYAVQVIELSDQYLAAQKRVNELLQQVMQLTSNNSHLNQQIDSLTAERERLEMQIDNLTVELETAKVLTPEPVPAKRTRTKKPTN